MGREPSRLGEGLVIALTLTQPEYDAETIEEIYTRVVKHYTGYTPSVVVTHCRGSSSKVYCVPRHPTSPLQALGYLVETLGPLLPLLPRCRALVAWGPLFLPHMLFAKMFCGEVVLVLLGDWPEVVYWKTVQKWGPRLAGALKALVEALQRLAVWVSTRTVTNTPSLMLRYRRANMYYKLQPLLAAQARCPGEAERSSIAYIGRLDYEKGVPRLLRAYALYAAAARRRGRRPRRLVVAGDGPLRGLVEKTAKAIATVEYRGYVDHRLLHSIYCSARAVVIPSYTEGLPTVLLEAVMHRVPVVLVSREIGFLAKIVSARGTRVVVFRDEEQLAEQLLSLDEA